MNKVILAIIFLLISTGVAQKKVKLTFDQKIKLAYYYANKRERDAKKAQAANGGHTTRQPSSQVASVKDVTISIFEASTEEIKKARIFTTEKQLEQYKSAREYFVIYKIMFKNSGKKSARFVPQTQTFYTKSAYVSQAKRRTAFDRSFLGAFNNYYDNLYSRTVEPGAVGYNYVMLPRVKKLIANVGVTIGGEEYGVVVLEIGKGSKLIKL